MTLDDLRIDLNLDTVGYSRKPDQEMANIRNRLCSSERIERGVTIASLIQHIKAGKAFTPSVMTGTGGATWQSQQLICADIDNEYKDPVTKKKIKLTGPERMTIKEACDALARYGVYPAFVYPTYSTEVIDKQYTRFRIIIALEETITDADAAVDYTRRVADLLNQIHPNCADTGMADRARLLLGTSYEVFRYPNGQPASLAVMAALPKQELPAPSPRPAPAERSRATVRQYSYSEAKEIICLDWRNLISNITEPAKRRVHGEESWICPICGHGKSNDGLTFNPDSVTGYGLVCHGAGTEGKDRNKCFVGNIIDLFMRVRGTDFNQTVRDLAAMEHIQIQDHALDWNGQPMEPAWREEIQPLPEDYTPEQLAARQEEELDRSAAAGAGAIDAFLADVQGRKYEPMPTGIADIDKAIGGGFIRQQLILLGAAPGAGKTALAQWIFEGMAKRGTSCIFLNLEMSREQMLARSLARYVATQPGAPEVTTTNILQGYKWTDAQRRAILRAAEEYRREVAPRLVYNPENVTADLDSILAYIEYAAERYEAAKMPAPVVVIDYLQIIVSAKDRDAVETIKRSVSSLKDYAVKHDTIVFVIMAHGRESNKSGDITMESGRDTSAIEYSADLQLGLAFTRCLKRNDDKPKKLEDLTPEDRQFLTLKVTKGRFCRPGVYVDLQFRGESMSYYQVMDAPNNWTSRSF